MITVLGSGTSTGVPEYRCDCDTCRDARQPGSPNARTRPALHAVVDGVAIQFDTGPNFLEQIDRHRIDRIDAVIYTHCHADHISGTNDLVMPCRKQQMDMPIYGPDETMRVLQKNFDYMFTKETYQGGGVAHLVPHSVSDRFDVEGVEVIPIPVRHGAVDTQGYRVGPFAYVPDVKEMPDESLVLMDGVRLLIIDGLSFNPRHPTHISVAESVEISNRLGNPVTYLTHLTHRIDHKNFKEQCEQQGVDLQPHVELAFDGMQVTV
jgi:phosphoribosyl 1,2-cyclic phosphate phosphodiesterase